MDTADPIGRGTGVIERLEPARRRGVIRDRRDESLRWDFDGAAVRGQGFDVLPEGDAVEFTLHRGPEGLVARNVSRLIATNESPLGTAAGDDTIPPPLEDAPD